MLRALFYLCGTLTGLSILCAFFLSLTFLLLAFQGTPASGVLYADLFVIVIASFLFRATRRLRQASRPPATVRPSEINGVGEPQPEKGGEDALPIPVQLPAEPRRWQAAIDSIRSIRPGSEAAVSPLIIASLQTALSRIAPMLQKLTDRSALNRTLASWIEAGFAAAAENALSLIVQLLVLILVERSYGAEGLGVFAYLTSLVLFGSYLSDFGIARYMEIHIARAPEKRQALIHRGMRGIMCGSILFAVSMIGAAAFSGKLTHLAGMGITYLLAIACVYLRNRNAIIFALMRTLNRHGRVSRLKAFKRLIYLAAIYICQWVHLPPPLLIAGILVSEGWIAFKIRKEIRLPGLMALTRGDSPLALFRESQKHLFVDEPFDAMAHMNMMALGFFVSSQNLGAYAQAMILVHGFLVLPVSLQPLLRSRYLAWSEKRQYVQMQGFIDWFGRTIFGVQALLALYFLTFFPEIMRDLFNSRHLSAASFQCFAMMLPGLLAITPVMIAEPVYEALSRVGRFRDLVLKVTAVNLILNVYLIPFAGIMGAAAATALSLLGYFGFFGRDLRVRLGRLKMRFFYAGAAIYLVHAGIGQSGAGGVTRFLAVPVCLVILFWMTGFFEPSVTDVPD